MFCKIIGDILERFKITVARIRTCAAVNMNVDKAGKNDFSAHINAVTVYKPDFADFAVFDFYVAEFLFKLFVEKGAVFKYHYSYSLIILYDSSCNCSKRSYFPISARSFAPPFIPFV